ncbi:MAG: hypothetical protein Q7K44_00445, partial [Candidatus Liptonbacteria bacterium]|nr:hypothetical protein [Candidatus Liptonbacteria bacterium]
MKEKDATLGQGIKMLTLIEQKETPCEQLQKLLASGLLSDLLDADVDGIDRDTFRRVIGLKPIEHSFPLWKTIKLDTGLKTADDFRKALKQSGCKIGNWGNDILGNPAFTVSDTETEVDLVNVSVAELGFKNGAPRKDIYERAVSLGLELCPNEVGPQLRLQYTDQPKGEWLRIAMEPITGSDG